MSLQVVIATSHTSKLCVVVHIMKRKSTCAQRGTKVEEGCKLETKNLVEWKC
jgi:hypothetical protein